MYYLSKLMNYLNQCIIYYTNLEHFCDKYLNISNISHQLMWEYESTDGNHLDEYEIQICEIHM